MLKSWPVKLIILLTSLLIILAFIIYFYLRSGLADYSAEYQVNGISGTIEIIRDANAVPHIYATQQDDLAFGMGYVMAEDRLWQMDLFKRVATGRLSEVFGRKTIKADRFAKISGFGRKSQQLMDELPPKEKSYLVAFVHGINHYITYHPNKTPIEFKLLNYQPEPFTVQDIIALFYYKSYVSNHNWKYELLRASAMAELGPKKGRELVPATTFNGPFMAEPEVQLENEGTAKIIPFEVNDSPEAAENQILPVQYLFDQLLAMDTQVKNISGLEANEVHSNYWAISGKRSQSGSSIFANDYHMPLLLPSLWYQLHIVGDGIDAMGITMPGTPTILAGHNQYVAWGATTTGADTQDLVWEKLNPDNDNEYLYKGKFFPFITHQEIIYYRQDNELKSETLQVRLTRHGPIINDIINANTFIQKADFIQPIALQTVENSAKGQMGFAMDIYRVHDWESFRNAIRQIRTPVWNWGYADINGNIGYRLNGSIPIRKEGDGLEPKPGWTGDYDWRGYVDFDDLPENYNPKEGFIVSANNQVLSDPMSPMIAATTFQLPYRAMRIEELIRAKDKLTQQDMQDIQQDTMSLFGLVLKNEILSAINTMDNPPFEIAEIKSIVENWQGDTKIDSIATTIIQEFFIKLLENTFANKISDSLFEQFISSGNLNYVAGVLLANLNEPSLHHWFDDPDTPLVETRQETVIASLLDAHHSLREYFGDQITEWKWGKIHQTYFQHQMGKVAPFKWLWNIGPEEHPGDFSTVNPGTYRQIKNKPYRSEHGASMRHIVDFGHPDQSSLVITTGQSGHWLSKYYDDQAVLWHDAKYLNIPTKKSEIIKHSIGVTRFELHE